MPEPQAVERVTSKTLHAFFIGRYPIFNFIFIMLKLGELIGFKEQYYEKNFINFFHFSNPPIICTQTYPFKLAPYTNSKKQYCQEKLHKK